MKWEKILSIMLVVAFVIGTANAFPENGFKAKKIKIEIPAIAIEKQDEYISIEMEGASYYYSPGKPVLPKIDKVIELPFGVRVKNVEVKIEGIEEREIGGRIKPSFGPLPMKPYMAKASLPKPDMSIYNSSIK